MKNTITFLTLLFISLPFTSCIEDLTNVDFSTDITEKFDVHINQNQTAISQSIILQLDNSDTHDYLNNINEVSITKLTYKVTNFTGDATGSIDIEFSSDGTVLLLNDFIVKQANDNATIYEISNVTHLNQIAAALKNNQQVELSVSGECLAENDDMDFDIEVTAELDIVANPL